MCSVKWVKWFFTSLNKRKALLKADFFLKYHTNYFPVFWLHKKFPRSCEIFLFASSSSSCYSQNTFVDSNFSSFFFSWTSQREFSFTWRFMFSFIHFLAPAGSIWLQGENVQMMFWVLCCLHFNLSFVHSFTCQKLYFTFLGNLSQYTFPDDFTQNPEKVTKWNHMRNQFRAQFFMFND